MVYSANTNQVLTDLARLLIPASLMDFFDACPASCFNCGSVLVEVHNYRIAELRLETELDGYIPPNVDRVWLRPSARTIAQDLFKLQRSGAPHRPLLSAIGDPQWNSQEIIAFEQVKTSPAQLFSRQRLFVLICSCSA